jgi:hypothetical protein
LGTERYWFQILLLPHITIKKLNYGINLFEIFKKRNIIWNDSFFITRTFRK